MFIFYTVVYYIMAGRCLKTIDELKVTHFFTVPEVYKQLSTMDDSDLFQNYDLSSLKVIVTGI